MTQTGFQVHILAVIRDNKLNQTNSVIQFSNQNPNLQRGQMTQWFNT